jgi:hypothetical protein
MSAKIWNWRPMCLRLWNPGAIAVSWCGVVKLFDCNVVLWEEDENGEQAVCKFGYWLICMNLAVTLQNLAATWRGQHERGGEGGRHILPWPVRSLPTRRLRHRIIDMMTSGAWTWRSSFWMSLMSKLCHFLRHLILLHGHRYCKHRVRI